MDYRPKYRFVISIHDDETGEDVAKRDTFLNLADANALADDMLELFDKKQKDEFEAVHYPMGYNPEEIPF